MHAAFLLLALLPQSPQPSRHAIAIVNDARSHGTVGDAFLSLNEVIQLCNDTLLEERLSAAERAQIRGEGEPSSVHVDATAVPVLRMERQLDEVADSIHGFFLEGLNGIPTIDCTGTRGIVSRARTRSFGRLRLTGGDFAIDSVTDSVHHTCWVHDVECVGQRVAGVRLVSRGAAAFWRLIDGTPSPRSRAESTRKRACRSSR